MYLGSHHWRTLLFHFRNIFPQCGEVDPVHHFMVEIPIIEVSPDTIGSISTNCPISGDKHKPDDFCVEEQEEQESSFPWNIEMGQLQGNAKTGIPGKEKQIGKQYEDPSFSD